MKIGQIAKQLDLSTDSIRFYEKMDLIKSERLSNGYRHYGKQLQQELYFIKKMKELNFSLKEIGSMLSVLREKGATAKQAKDTVLQKIESIDQQISSLQLFKKVLKKLPINESRCPFTNTSDVMSDEQCSIIDEECAIDLEQIINTLD